MQCKKYSINCLDLNSLITNDDIKREYENSIDTYINFLNELDNNNKENLKFFDDLPTLDWFFSLFRVVWKLLSPYCFQVEIPVL